MADLPTSPTPDAHRTLRPDPAPDGSTGLDPELWDDLRALFPERRGMRSIVRLAVDRVATSCGYGVPKMELVAPRTTMSEWAGRKSDADLAAYRQAKNRTSIDGLPALDGEPAPAP